MISADPFCPMVAGLDIPMISQELIDERLSQR